MFNILFTISCHIGNVKVEINYIQVFWSDLQVSQE